MNICDYKLHGQGLKNFSDLSIGDFFKELDNNVYYIKISVNTALCLDASNVAEIFKPETQCILLEGEVIIYDN